MQVKRVTAIIVDRANYGRLLPVLKTLHQDPRFNLHLVLGGSFVLTRYGAPWRMLARDGLDQVPRETVYHEVDGNCPQSRAQSIGLGVCGYAAAIERTGSPWVLIIGDRYEALAAAQGAVFTGRCLVHFQGGEVSGTMDEPTRHAISQLAHYHVPATELARHTLVERLGQHRQTILATGCPVSDLTRQLRGGRPQKLPPYMLVMYHPSGPDPGGQMDRLLHGVYPFAGPGGLDLRVWWPNIDPESDRIAARIRDHRRRHKFDVIRHVHPVDFLRLLRDARVCVGNSSAFVRDTGYFGTPVVAVGDRQSGRERTANTCTVPCDTAAIRRAVLRELNHGRYLCDSLYGDGKVAERFADALAGASHYQQKHLDYLEGHRHERPEAPAACADAA